MTSNAGADDGASGFQRALIHRQVWARLGTSFQCLPLYGLEILIAMFSGLCKHSPLVCRMRNPWAHNSTPSLGALTMARTLPWEGWRWVDHLSGCKNGASGTVQLGTEPDMM